MKTLNVLVLIIVCVSQLKAQKIFTSLDDVWSYADKNNIQLRAAKASEEAASYNIKQAYGKMLPVVSANGTFTDNSIIQSTLIPASLFNPTAPADTYSEATFGRKYAYNASLTAQLNILNTQDWFNIETAKLRNEIEYLNTVKTKTALYEQLATVYYTFILLTEAEKLSMQNVQIATAVYNLAINKFEEGLASELTVNTARISKEKAKINLDVAVENKVVQLNRLKLMLGIADSVILLEKFESRINRAETETFTKDPDEQIANMQLILSKTQLKSLKFALAPTLTAVYQYSTQVAADDFLVFSNSNTLPQQYWGLRLSVPIFSGNLKRYEIQKAQVDYSLKEQQYESARLQSSINNQNILISYNSSFKVFQKSKDILHLYQSNDAHAERKMNEGVISLDERLKYFSDLVASQNEYLQSMSDYFIQEYRLKIRQTNLIR